MFVQHSSKGRFCPNLDAQNRDLTTDILLKFKGNGTFEIVVRAYKRIPFNYYYFIFVMAKKAQSILLQSLLDGHDPFEPWEWIFNNVVCATCENLRSACAYAQSDQSLC